jgi:hypothetical protein
MSRHKPRHHFCSELCPLCFPVSALAAEEVINRKTVITLNSFRECEGFPILTASQIREARELWTSLQESSEEESRLVNSMSEVMA